MRGYARRPYGRLTDASAVRFHTAPGLLAVTSSNNLCMKKETSFIQSRLRNSQLAALPLAGGLFVAPAVSAEVYGQRSQYKDREYEPRERDRTAYPVP
jgi:hypothetical protein